MLPKFADMSRHSLFAGCATALAWASANVYAQPADAYPTKPIRMIVPFPPGGSNDIIGRYLANHLSERFGKQVVIDNRGGAGGLIGTETAANAVADGHTLLLISVAYTMNAAIYKLPYDSVKSFARVAQLGTGPSALAAYPGLPANSVKELIALARAKPNTVVYATAGIGSFQHFASELFRTTAGISMVHVPYKGGAPAMVDTIAGQAQICLGSLIQFLPHFRTGKLKALGTGGARRTPVLPDVPAIAEDLPGYESNNWWGILAPAATPTAVIKKLNAEINRVMQMPETQKRFASEGADPVSGTPEEFSRLIANEMVKWAKVAKTANIKAE
jgi:tripartite-type tricarboxylate transporter receptor subunit TctC